MKNSLKILFIAAALIAGTTAEAKKAKEIKETPASDTRIEYTGRILKDGADVSYDWSGTYFRVRFNGPYLAMKCSDSKNSWFNLWIDKDMTPEADRKFLVAAKDTLIVLAEGLGRESMRSSCRKGPKENRDASLSIPF